MIYSVGVCDISARARAGGHNTPKHFNETEKISP